MLYNLWRLKKYVKVSKRNPWTFVATLCRKLLSFPPWYRTLLASDRSWRPWHGCSAETDILGIDLEFMLGSYCNTCIDPAWIRDLQPSETIEIQQTWAILAVLDHWVFVGFCCLLISRGPSCWWTSWNCEVMAAFRSAFSNPSALWTIREGQYIVGQRAHHANVSCQCKAEFWLTKTILGSTIVVSTTALNNPFISKAFQKHDPTIVCPDLVPSLLMMCLDVCCNAVAQCRGTTYFMIDSFDILWYQFWDMHILHRCWYHSLSKPVSSNGLV